MRKAMWSTAAGVLLLSGAGVLLGPGAQAADGRVTIVEPSPNDALKWTFDPAEVTVSAGSTVTWHNGGAQGHTVTANDGAFDSGNVSPGADFQWKPSAAGDFAYHCEPHPWMKAVVHVVGGSTPTTAAPSTTTQPASSGTTATTAKNQPSTTTTTKPGTSTTTTAAADPTTTTTLGSATTPTSAPDSAGVTTTSSGPAEHEVAAGPPEGGAGHDDGETNLVGVALAGILTLGLGGISAKLLASKP